MRQDPTTAPETPEAIEDKFNFDMDDRNDVPILGGVDVSYWYYVNFEGKAVVEKTDIEASCHLVDLDCHEQAMHEIDARLHPMEVIYK